VTPHDLSPFRYNNHMYMVFPSTSEMHCKPSVSVSSGIESNPNFRTIVTG
jgi:hypothetical protein